MVELIVTEKPSAALKIAAALADGKPTKKTVNRVAYYELLHRGRPLLVVCAVGHLYTVAEKDKKGWTYPTFSVEWKTSAEVNKSSAFTEKYLNVIKKLARDAESFTVATDFDIEGEVIGFNIIRLACHQKDARRMKFSALTTKELKDSYEQAHPHLEWGLVEAGLARHELDFFYGINISRALTLAIKNTTGMFKILSSGRVQGPSLKILADREKEIRAFVSTPFWQLELKTQNGLSAFHQQDKFWEKGQAQTAFQKVKGKAASVARLDTKQYEQRPPHPFDLTALQLEAYKTLGIPPRETLDLAQNLYLAGLISYPRTSSNQYPSALNFQAILKDLAKQPAFKELCHLLLSGPLQPCNGTKQDPAHPAIYATGEKPKKLDGRGARLYELITKRMLATFAKPALRETVTADLEVAGEHFLTKGTRTLTPEWHRFYQPFLKQEEVELPPMKEGQALKVQEVLFHEKETQPPKRYTAASIIKELEKRNLGTKATRAAIIEALHHRDYVQEKSLEVTDLGLKTVETLEKYCPEILDEQLTRHFEEEMEEIQGGKKKRDQVLEEAKKVLTTLLAHFRANEAKIGKELSASFLETRDQASIVGTCPSCQGNLRITYSKKNRSYFVACAEYPKCTTTFSLPYGLPNPARKACPDCTFPLVTIIRKGRRPYSYCINKNCPQKLEWIKQQQAKQAA